MIEFRKHRIENQIGNRKFGITFFVIFLLISMFFWYRASPFFIYPLAAALSFLLFAIFLPDLLRPLNISWFYFGLLLQKITTPIVLFVMFYLILFPLALILKAFGKYRKIKWNTSKMKQTYWKTSDKNETRFEHIF